MDDANIRNMQRMCGGDPQGKIHQLLDYTDRPGEVADPWYTGDFDATWRDVLEGCQGLLAQLAPGGGAEPPDPAAADALAGVETAALLNQLDPEARALFQLRYDEGYNAAELGQLFGQPPATIRTRLHRIRKHLQQTLKED